MRMVCARGKNECKWIWDASRANAPRKITNWLERPATVLDGDKSLFYYYLIARWVKEIIQFHHTNGTKSSIGIGVIMPMAMLNWKCDTFYRVSQAHV